MGTAGVNLIICPWETVAGKVRILSVEVLRGEKMVRFASRKSASAFSPSSSLSETASRPLRRPGFGHDSTQLDVCFALGVLGQLGSPAR